MQMPPGRKKESTRGELLRILENGMVGGVERLAPKERRFPSQACFFVQALPPHVVWEGLSVSGSALERFRKVLGSCLRICFIVLRAIYVRIRLSDLPHHVHVSRTPRRSL